MVITSQHLPTDRFPFLLPLLLALVVVTFVASSPSLDELDQKVLPRHRFPLDLLDAIGPSSSFVKKSNSGRLLRNIDKGEVGGGDEVEQQEPEEHQSHKKNFCFISHGCWGGSDFGKVTHRKVADLIASKTRELGASFVLAAGDNFYTKGIKSVNDKRFNDTFTNVYIKPPQLQPKNKEATTKSTDRIMKNVPFVVALGNHDARGSIPAQLNMTYLDPNWFFPHTYYSVIFRRKAIALVIVVLDCPLFERCAVNPPGSARCWDNNAQKDFLESALVYAIDKFQVQHRVVVCHYPLYANGPHLNHQFLKNLLDPVMEKYGVSMYINADNHYMQVSRKINRRRYQRGGGDAEIYYVNSGGGGGYRLHKKTDKGYLLDKHSVFEFLGNGVFTHCINLETKKLRTSAYTTDDHGEKELYSFEVEPVGDGAVNVRADTKALQAAKKSEIESRNDNKYDVEVQKEKESTSSVSSQYRQLGLVRPADLDSTALSVLAMVCVVGGVCLYRIISRNRNQGKKT